MTPIPEQPPGDDGSPARGRPQGPPPPPGPGQPGPDQPHSPGPPPGHPPGGGHAGGQQGRPPRQPHGNHPSPYGPSGPRPHPRPERQPYGDGHGGARGGNPHHGEGHGDVPGEDHNGHGHGHGHGPAAPVSRHLRKIIAMVLIPFALAVGVGLVALWPGGVPGHGGDATGIGFDRPTLAAKVVKIAEVDCEDVNAQQPPQQQPGGQQPGADGGKAQGGSCQKATVEVTEGEDAGHTFTEVVTPDATRTFTVGQEVVAAYAEKAPRKLQYSVIDANREMPMVLLAAVFALAVVVVGRLRGLLALVGLVVSFAVLTLFILPAILQGSDPLLVAVVGGSAIMLATLYLCHGLSARTSVAVLGTLVSLLLIGVLGSLFIGWGELTGNTDDTTGLVHGLYPDIEIKGLLLAGVLIGSLGVLDDVTVTQTAAVWELKAADPTAGWRRIYRSAMRIGRDHIASVVNTLVLAYAGAALPLLLLFSVARSGVSTVATSEMVAEEIVRTLVGSIGLVISVPVTTLLAALVVTADRRWRGGADEPAPAPAPEGSAAPATAGGPGVAGGEARGVEPSGAGASLPDRAPPGARSGRRSVVTNRRGRRRKPK